MAGGRMRAPIVRIKISADNVDGMTVTFQRQDGHYSHYQHPSPATLERLQNELYPFRPDRVQFGIINYDGHYLETIWTIPSIWRSR